MLAPFPEELGPVPFRHFQAEAVGRQLPHRQQDVRVRIALVPVDVQIGDHAERDKLALDEFSRQRDRLGLPQLGG